MCLNGLRLSGGRKDERRPSDRYVIKVDNGDGTITQTDIQAALCTLQRARGSPDLALRTFSASAPMKVEQGTLSLDEAKIEQLILRPGEHTSTMDKPSRIQELTTLINQHRRPTTTLRRRSPRLQAYTIFLCNIEFYTRHKMIQITTTKVK